MGTALFMAKIRSCLAVGRAALPAMLERRAEEVASKGETLSLIPGIKLGGHAPLVRWIPLSILLIVAKQPEKAGIEAQVGSAAEGKCGEIVPILCLKHSFHVFLQRAIVTTRLLRLDTRSL